MKKKKKEFWLKRKKGGILILIKVFWLEKKNLIKKYFDVKNRLNYKTTIKKSKYNIFRNKTDYYLTVYLTPSYQCCFLSLFPWPK